MTETKEFSEEEAVNEGLETMNHILALRQSYRRGEYKGFKSGQESVIKNYTPFPFDEAVKQARQDTLEEVEKHLHRKQSGENWEIDPDIWEALKKEGEGKDENVKNIIKRDH